MLAAQIYREWHLGGGLSGGMQSSRVPRCLFGQANSRETIEMLQEALNEERARFAKRWGVDPMVEDEDKENVGAVGGVGAAGNNVVSSNGKVTVVRLSTTTPNKRRNIAAAASCPYAKQTSIQDYLRSKKSPAKKSSSGALTEIKQNQQPSSSSQAQTNQQQPGPSIKSLLLSPKRDRSF